jgi:ATP-dependent Clp protease ATP-binding subunit ClpA
MIEPLTWALDGADRMRLSFRLSLRGFTDHAVTVVLAARAEAARRNHREVTAGHILLGLATTGPCVGKVLLNRLGVDLARDTEEIAACVGPSTPGAPGGRLVLAAEANGLLERARAEARGVWSMYVGTEHLVFALFTGEGAVADYLRRRGITLQRLTVELQRLNVELRPP